MPQIIIDTPIQAHTRLWLKGHIGSWGLRINTRARYETVAEVIERLRAMCDEAESRLNNPNFPEKSGE